MTPRAMLVKLASMSLPVEYPLKRAILIDTSSCVINRVFAALSYYRRTIGKREDESEHMWHEDEKFVSMMYRSFDRVADLWLARFKRKTFGSGPITIIYCFDDKSTENWRQKYQQTHNKDHPYKGGRKHREEFKQSISLLFEYAKKRMRDTGALGLQRVGTEADDLIAVLALDATRFSKDAEIGIVSNDLDLQQIPRVYSISVQGSIEFIQTAAAKQCLWKKIIQGDKSDNIPYVLGGTGKKIKSLLDTADYKALEQWVSEDMERKKRYEYAKIMIDFNYIPRFVWSDIQVQFGQTVLQRMKNATIDGVSPEHIIQQAFEQGLFQYDDLHLMKDIKRNQYVGLTDIPVDLLLRTEDQRFALLCHDTNNKDVATLIQKVKKIRRCSADIKPVIMLIGSEAPFCYFDASVHTCDVLGLLRLTDKTTQQCLVMPRSVKIANE